VDSLLSQELTRNTRAKSRKGWNKITKFLNRCGGGSENKKGENDDIFIVGNITFGV
jgi:hypothetical protein